VVEGFGTEEDGRPADALLAVVAADTEHAEAGAAAGTETGVHIELVESGCTVHESVIFLVKKKKP
jgi:hypothetical protein